MKRIEIKECHQILLDIMNEIHSICVSANIPYYMLGGSMLGAIRHQGFIPWDDDFDIGIERKYYEQFITIAIKQLPKHLKVSTHKNSKGIFLGFAKIQDTRTIIYEKTKKSLEEKYRYGINVDIFPLDSCGEDLRGYKLIRTVFRLHRFIFFDSTNRNNLNSFFRKVIRSIWPFQKNFSIEVINRLIKIFSNENGDYLISYWSGHGKKAVIPKCVFGTPQKYKFENYMFFGPENYEDYLGRLFGNYMEFPPESKRQIHSEKKYWKTKKYKLGYTTGVFDMFHIGHLNILKRAKELCDELIVGVSTDELVLSYKNKTPVIPFKERFEIVSSIRYVDKVVAQTHRDKVKAWEDIGFDVMFVGSDWKGSELFNEVEKEFNEKGVDLIYLPHTDGVSSTFLLEKLKLIYG